MATMLRQVLERFEDQHEPVMLAQIARDLHVEMSILQDMIDYWVRKGKLRAVDGTCAAACSCCGSEKSCPFVMPLPTIFERVYDEPAGVTPAARAAPAES